MTDTSELNQQGGSTIPQFANRYHLGVATVWREIKRGKLEAVKIGRTTRILSDAEKRYLDSLPRRESCGEGTRK